MTFVLLGHSPFFAGFQNRCMDNVVKVITSVSVPLDQKNSWAKFFLCQHPPIFLSTKLLVNRDPYNGLLNSLSPGVVKPPTYTKKTSSLFHCSMDFSGLARRFCPTSFWPVAMKPKTLCGWRRQALRPLAFGVFCWMGLDDGCQNPCFGIKEWKVLPNHSNSGLWHLKLSFEIYFEDTMDLKKA